MKQLLLGLMIGGIALAKAQEIKSTPFGKGLRFMAVDSSMSMKFQLRMQSLFVAEQSLAPNSKLESEFLIRRYRLKFGGHIHNPNLLYKMELGISNRDIGVNREDGNGSGASRIILDAVLKYKFCKHWAIWVGQTKLPGNRERVVSSANLQFVDRSLVNSRFNIDRDVGIQLHGKYSLGNFIIKPKLSWAMGEGRNITAGNFGGWNYTGRVDFLPMGEFTSKGDYFLADLKREEKLKIAFGATYNLNDRAVRQQGQLGRFVYDSTGVGYAENTLSSTQLDMILKYRGFSTLIEYAITSAEKQIDGTSSNFNTGSGINVQSGYVFKNNFEIAGRYTHVAPDDIAYSGIGETTEYTLCFSKYIVGHNLKIQTDFALIDRASASDPEARFRFQTEMQF